MNSLTATLKQLSEETGLTVHELAADVRAFNLQLISKRGKSPSQWIVDRADIPVYFKRKKLQLIEASKCTSGKSKPARTARKSGTKAKGPASPFAHPTKRLPNKKSTQNTNDNKPKLHVV